MGIKQLQAECDERSSKLVAKLGEIEQKMKQTKTLAGLRRLHDDVQKVQTELNVVSEMAVMIKGK